MMANTPRLKSAALMISVLIAAHIGLIEPSYADTQHLGDNSIVIGLVNNFTDFKSPCGDPQGKNFKNAVYMALEDFLNAHEGYKGKIQLKSFSYGSDVLNTDKATQEAIDQGAIALVGYPCSSYAVLAAPVAERNHTPLITPSATIDSLTENRRYIFRAAFRDEDQAKAMAKFLSREKGKHRAIIIANADYPYCMNMSDKFSHYFEKYGGSIVKRYHVLSKKTDFSDVLRDLSNYKYDVILIPNHEMESSIVVGQLLDAGIHTTIAGGDGWGNLYGYIFPKHVGDKNLDAYAIAHWSLDATNSRSKSFAQRYHDKYDAFPNDNSALAYDAMSVLLEAVKSAKSPTREDIRDALAELGTYEGVTGSLRYRAGDGTPSKTIYIVSYQNHRLSNEGSRRFVIYRKIQPDA